MASTAPLKRALGNAASELLAPLGFGRFPRQPGIYRCDLTAGVIGMVGISCSSYRSRGEAEIGAGVYVHVRHERVERVVEELQGPPSDPRDARARPTRPTVVGGHLGYLMPHRSASPWWLAREEDAPSVVSDMVAAIEAYGLPFMRSQVRLEAIHETLKRCRGQLPGECLVRLPVVSVLLGEIDRARREIGMLLDRSRGTDAHARFYAEHYRPYAERFLAYLDRFEREELPR